MRPQKTPSLNCANYLSDIIVSKQTSRRRRLKHERNNIDVRIAEFSPKLEKLLSISKKKWSHLTSNALISCYGSSTIPLVSLKDSMLSDLRLQGDVNIEKCPYCMLKPPSTWDHYFPQVHYPEFSVFHGNLIYICSDCNRRKGAHHSEKQLEFLHPYFYGAAHEIILFCSASLIRGRLSLQYYSAPSRPELASLAAIGQRHITNLKLLPDFQIESATVINNFLAAIKEEFPSGISEKSLNRLIRKNYSLVENVYGPNAWEARLWHAILNFADFITYANAQLIRLPGRFREGIDQPPPPPP
jgi:5-methylcytosine-specific restriction endonuclease McrA